MYYLLILAGIGFALAVPYSIFHALATARPEYLLQAPLLATLSGFSFYSARRVRQHELVLEDAARATVAQASQPREVPLEEDAELGALTNLELMEHFRQVISTLPPAEALAMGLRFGMLDEPLFGPGLGGEWASVLDRYRQLHGDAGMSPASLETVEQVFNWPRERIRALEMKVRAGVLDRARSRRSATPQQRLTTLSELLAQGAITHEEYERQRARIIEDL